MGIQIQYFSCFHFSPGVHINGKVRTSLRRGTYAGGRSINEFNIPGIEPMICLHWSKYRVCNVSADNPFHSRPLRWLSAWN